MPPLLNVNATVQCAHGGRYQFAPRGIRPMVGGAPMLTLADVPGTPAVGCAFNIAGAPVPCVAGSAIAGICVTVMTQGGPALHQGVLIQPVSPQPPSLPCASTGSAAMVMGN